MVVGFDATTIRGHKSGVGYYTARLLERLTRLGGSANPIDHLVVLSNLKVTLPADLPRATVYEGGQLGVRALWMQGVLPFLLRRICPDVCHFTNFLAPLAADCRYVVTFHDMSLQLMPGYHTLKKRWMTATLMPEVARRARLIIAPSESAREDISRILGIPMSKIRVIPHAPDSHFRPEPAEASFAPLAARYGIRKPYLLYVGTLEPRKNLQRALEAFARLSRSRFPDHSFYLVGELGWKYREILTAVEKIGLGQKVKRLGYVAEEELPALYSHADLFVYPSLYEGFGFPVVEAMACGAPVLTSNSSSLREIGGGAALLVDPLDVAAMAEAMERGLTPGRERNELISRGLARARSFSWERTILDTLAVYEEAAERAARRSRAPAAPAAEAARAIARTVAYGAIFDYPMKLAEIHRGLFGLELEPSEIAAILEAHPDLRARLERRGAYYFLRGRGKSVPQRWSRERFTRELLDRHRRNLDLIRRAPYVRLVALSGATAHGNTADRDIDLFLITAPGRAWAVSFLLFLGAKLFGLRRVLCINYLLSERALALPEQDPFTAHQIVSLRPLAGWEAYLRFVGANPWVAEHFPNFWQHYRDLAKPEGASPPAGSPWLEAVLAFGGGWALERLGRVLHRGYLRRRLRRAGAGSAVKLEDERIKLHFKDHGLPLNVRLQSILGETDGRTDVVAGSR